MKTDQLISAIAQDAGAKLPSLIGRISVALGVGGIVSLALLLATLGIRPDIADALQTWRFDAKLISMSLVAAAALLATTALVRPDADGRKAALPLVLPLFALVLAVAAELATTPAGTWGVRAVGSNSRLCLTAVIVYALGPLAALLVTLRAGAPASPAWAGAAAGLLAGGIGASFYAMHCVDDSPLFVLLWYLPPIAVMALAGALLGRFVLRW